MNLPNILSPATQCKFGLFVFVVLLLTGCGSTTCPSTGCISSVPINGGNDKLEWVPALRVGINFSDSKQIASQPHTGHAVEFGITQTRGSSTQLVSANEQVALNSSTFVGPQSIADQFDLSYADISYRWRKFPRNGPLGFELTGGLGFPTLNLSVSTPTQRATRSFSNTGLQGGLGLIWHFDPDTYLQTRVAGYNSGNMSLDISTGVSSMSRYELSLSRAFGENLSLRAGFARWKISGQTGIYQSEFKLRSYGPTLVFEWDFNARRSSTQLQPDQNSNVYQP